MKTVILGVVVALFMNSLVPASSAQDVQLYECTAQNRLAGREQAMPDSPQLRMSDGQLRYVEKGDPGYTSTAMGEPVPQWIELFGAQNGHASSFLGFYLSKDFKCEKLEG